MDSGIEDTTAGNKPSPTNFDAYLPWACLQLQLEATVLVMKNYQHEYVSTATDRSKKGKSRGKLAHSRTDVTPGVGTDDDSGLTVSHRVSMRNPKIISVLSVYDTNENLVHIQFDRNVHIPRVMMKIIGIIIQFQNQLTNITINDGLDEYTVYEIGKFLPESHITEICLDDCCLQRPNYHLLLEKSNLLKHLSLCRCKIDDGTIESICSALVYPLPASKTLSILNLASNRITDDGAKSIANALRSNRKLSYLNLASNLITDVGASAILDTLMEFPLTAESVIAARSRQMTFLKEKNKMIELTLNGLRMGDSDKKMLKMKSTRPSPSAKKMKSEVSQKSLVDPPSKYTPEIDNAMLAKAVAIVENALGKFADPFSRVNNVVRNGITYCIGNNALCDLNVSFNNLSFVTLRKLRAVLTYQRLLDRQPKGLMNVTVEGNSLPVSCSELTQINEILDIGLSQYCRGPSVSKKRVAPKSSRNQHV